MQDHRGYVWLATDQGLFRFDGQHFDDFNLTLRSKYIRSLASLDAHSIVFSNDTGIHILSYEEDQVVIRNYLDSDVLEYPTTLFVDTQQRLWVAQLNGTIAMFESGESRGKVFSLTADEKVPHMYLEQDKFGTIWALVPERGVYQYVEKDNTFVPLAHVTEANHFTVLEDELWLVGQKLERIKVDDRAKVVSRKQVSATPELNYITMNSGGTVFLASDQSIFTFDPDQNQIRLQKVFGSNDPHRVEELPFRSIHSIEFTLGTMNLNDAVWVSADNGLGLLWTGFFQTVSGLGYDNVTGLHATDKGNVLVSQGAISTIYRNNSSMAFTTDATLNGATGISSDGDNVWYGTTAGKIYKYQNGKQSREYDLSDRGSGIFFMSTDHRGDVWFCQATSNKPLIGVAKLDTDGKVVAYGRDKGFDSRILVIREGGKNELYAAGIGKDSYLYKYDRSTDRFTNKSLSFPFKVSDNFEVHDIAVDHLGIVWMATTDGLIKYDTESVRKVNLGTFTDQEVRAVATMADSALWASTDTNGLVYLSPEGDHVVFDEKCGTPSKVSSYRCLSLDTNSQLWVGTAEGLVYSSQSLPSPLETVSPILRDAFVDNKLEALSDISLRVSQQLKLSFTTLTFPSNEVIYQYKVFDHDLPWDEIVDIPWKLSDNSAIVLSSLPAGDLKFWVRAQKPGGFSWSKPTEVRISVVKPWYASWWGIVLISILAFLFFWYFVRRWFLKRIHALQVSLSQQQTELQAKEAMLVSQSSQLKHQKDELKSSGSNIYMLYRLIRQLPRASGWEETLAVLKKLVELPTEIDAFEVAYKKGEDVAYQGFTRGIAMKVERHEEFNEKENMASYVMVTHKPVAIDDFESEAAQYISGKDSGGYSSRICVPFQQEKGATAVLCVYNKQPNAFSQRDMTLIQILASFLSITIIDELK